MVSGLELSEVQRKLRRAGFSYSRRARGSYEVWAHQTSDRRVLLPRQGGPLSPATLRSIVRQASLTMEEFLNL